MNYQFDFSALLPYWGEFLSGAAVTLQLTVFSVAIGLVIGVLCAVARRSTLAWLRTAVGMYVEVIRNTPFIVQIFFIFFGLSSIGIRMPIVVAAIFALVINVGAYTAEIVRAGMDSIHPSQISEGHYGIPDASGSTMTATVHIAVPSPSLAENLAGSPRRSGPSPRPTNPAGGQDHRRTKPQSGK